MEDLYDETEPCMTVSFNKPSLVGRVKGSNGVGLVQIQGLVHLSLVVCLRDAADGLPSRDCQWRQKHWEEYW